jgi:hypothetical protein
MDPEGQNDHESKVRTSVQNTQNEEKIGIALSFKVNLSISGVDPYMFLSGPDKRIRNKKFL